MTQQKHISKQLDQDLDELKAELLAMGQLVDRQVSSAIDAFCRGDHGRAAEVIHGDDAVNQLERGIDQQCINLLARWQPEASDLRLVTAVLKIVTDLERIGDLAVSIAEQANQLDPMHRLRAVEDLSQIGEVALDMLRQALRAFLTRDEGGFQAVMTCYRDVEGAMQRLASELRDVMRENPASIPNGLATISVAKHVERTAAHASNIAEMVVYIARGEDVRHLEQP